MEDSNTRDMSHCATILSGDLRSDDVVDYPGEDPSEDDGRFHHYDENSYHVVLAHGVNQDAILEGVTVASGNANALDASSPHGYGGGMITVNASPTIRRCVFCENWAEFAGGGV